MRQNSPLLWRECAFIDELQHEFACVQCSVVVALLVARQRQKGVLNGAVRVRHARWNQVAWLEILTPVIRNKRPDREVLSYNSS